MTSRPPSPTSRRSSRCRSAAASSSPRREIYGGINAVWDYGPLGVELKNNVKRAWWRAMVQERDDVVGLDAGILMHPQVWVTSGPRRLVQRPARGVRDLPPALPARRAARCRGTLPRPSSATRRSSSGSGLTCPNDGGPLSAPRRFNLMFETHMGPVQDEALDRLPPTRDRAGLVRQLQERPAVEPQEDPVRHRPDRQELPQRDQPGQLRLPDARVRADGDAVLRPAGRAGRRRPSRSGCRAGGPGTRPTA